MRLSPTPEVVRSQSITTFQAPVLHVLGKVRDVGHEHADSGSEEEKRRHPAVEHTKVSVASRDREVLEAKEVELTESPCPSRA